MLIGMREIDMIEVVIGSKTVAYPRNTPLSALSEMGYSFKCVMRGGRK